MAQPKMIVAAHMPTTVTMASGPTSPATRLRARR